MIICPFLKILAEAEWLTENTLKRLQPVLLWLGDNELFLLFRICIDIGGCDITNVFACFLKESCFPYRSCNSEDRMDALLLEELKV